MGETPEYTEDQIKMPEYTKEERREKMAKRLKELEAQGKLEPGEYEDLMKLWDEPTGE